MSNLRLQPEDLVALLDRAAGSPRLTRNILTPDHKVKFAGVGPLPKGGLHHKANEYDINCSENFRAVGRELATLGFKIGHEWSRQWTANHLADYLRGLERQKGRSPWIRIQEDEVQGLANQGEVIVGLFRNHGNHSGHVAIAFPNLTRRATRQGYPLVRDGNEHLRNGHLYAGSWGAIGKQEAFGNHPVSWYRFELTRK